MPRKKRSATKVEEVYILPVPSAAEQLQRYRRYVGAVARGGRLTVEMEADLYGVLDTLELPSWAMRRDVAAVLRWQTADRRERVELLAAHPHLFDDADTWSAALTAQKSRRRPPQPSAESTGAAGL